MHSFLILYRIRYSIMDIGETSIETHQIAIFSINLFNIRIGPDMPKFGRMMRTTCESTSASSSFSICLGDALPTLQKMQPNKRIALVFHTTSPPTMIFSNDNGGLIV